MILRFERFLLEIEQFRLLAKKERLETRRVRKLLESSSYEIYQL